MTFPYSQNADVLATKITGYLLNLNHDQGKHKAKFFMKFGFSPSSIAQFKEALIVQGQTQTLQGAEETKFGVKFTVDCNIVSPDGRSPCIRTVWELRPGSVTPNLVTAFPKNIVTVSPSELDQQLSSL
jgi:hypothetical protein